MLIRIGVIFVLLTCTAAPPAFSATEGIAVEGFTNAWVDPKADFRSYEAAYIKGIDLRQVKCYSLADDGGTNTGDLDIQTMEKIADEMYQRFYGMLAGILPMVRDEEEVKGRKAVAMTLKLDGALWEERLLQKMLSGAFEKDKDLYFECIICDNDTGAELATLIDRRRLEEKDIIAVVRNDLYKWYSLMDIWADYLARFFAEKRGMGYQARTMER